MSFIHHGRTTRTFLLATAIAATTAVGGCVVGPSYNYDDYDYDYGYYDYGGPAYVYAPVYVHRGWGWGGDWQNHGGR